MKQKSKDVEFGQCFPLEVLPFVISRIEVKYNSFQHVKDNTKVLSNPFANKI